MVGCISKTKIQSGVTNPLTREIVENANNIYYTRYTVWHGRLRHAAVQWQQYCFFLVMRAFRMVFVVFRGV